jgi:hypothetical protein
MSKNEIPLSAAKTLLGLAKEIHSWIALGLTFATSLDAFFPKILAPIGLSTAIRPYFNLLGTVLIVFFLGTDFLRYSRVLPTTHVLRTVRAGVWWSFGFSVSSLVVYLVGAQLADDFIATFSPLRFQLLIYLVLAVPAALFVSFLAKAFFLLALQGHLSSRRGSRADGDTREV